MLKWIDSPEGHIIRFGNIFSTVGCVLKMQSKQHPEGKAD
jgi:hypothetical protein